MSIVLVIRTFSSRIHNKRYINMQTFIICSYVRSVLLITFSSFIYGEKFKIDKSF